MPACPLQSPVLDSVYSAAVNTTNGQIFSPGWQAEPALAAVHGSDNLTQGTNMSLIASPAVAAVNKPGGGGYLYVIGGEVPKAAGATLKFSSYAVQRATVGTNGRIAAPGWAELTNAQIPPPTHPTRSYIAACWAPRRWSSKRQTAGRLST